MIYTVCSFPYQETAFILHRTRTVKRPSESNMDPATPSYLHGMHKCYRHHEKSKKHLYMFSK